MSDRESMQFDVVIVGAGPAGLATAIRLKQHAAETGSDISVVVLEKSTELGGHILSGAIIDPVGLNKLIPNWKELGAPLNVPVQSDAFSLLTKTSAIALPRFVLPPIMSNNGNYIASLGNLVQWLGEQAAEMGVEIYPGFAATELLYSDRGEVLGVATGDMGRHKDGSQKPEFMRGMELRSKYTVLAEGARGSLAKQAIEKFDLEGGHAPQKYGLGLKEIWEVPANQHREGHVEHTLGWPLSGETTGGGFIYHAANNQVFLGLVVHLNYKNPHISPFDEFQTFKTHPKLKALLEGGKRIAYGARAVTSGGLHSIPELAYPGGTLVGCAAGFMNLPRLKGSHNAILSGMKIADQISSALSKGRANDVLEGARATVLDGEIGDDLAPVQSSKWTLSTFGNLGGMVASGIDLWSRSIFGGSPFSGHVGKADHEGLREAEHDSTPDYANPDGKFAFDRPSSVFLSNIGHDEDQPVHLQLKDAEVPVRENLPKFDEPAQRYCPAGVYEIAQNSDGNYELRINAANCIHCKTCDIKDPAQNITWVPPEGGSGPNYSGM